MSSTNPDLPDQLVQAVLIDSSELDPTQHFKVAGFDFDSNKVATVNVNDSDLKPGESDTAVSTPTTTCNTSTNGSNTDTTNTPIKIERKTCPFSNSELVSAPSGVNYDVLLDSYLHSGFQAQSYGKAVQEIRRMIDWNLNQEPIAHDEDVDFQNPVQREKVKCKIFLAYTSNLISSGLRETLRYLIQHRMVHVVTSSAGGVEEDLIKCLAPTFGNGEFSLKGSELRKHGLNRIGNMLVPNKNYCYFEDWLSPLLDKMHDEQDNEGVIWTPSTFIHRLGKEINNESSVCYWAYKNNIPLFCPGITDGSIGDMLFFHSFKRPGLIIDVVADIKRINEEAMHARKTGCIILGGGIVKHHTLNANLMRNGTDFAVYVSTAQEFDGSDSGARPDEAVSWGKIRIDAKPVKVYSEATLVFPLMVAQTFARERNNALKQGHGDKSDSEFSEKKFRYGHKSLDKSDSESDNLEEIILNKKYTDSENQLEIDKLGGKKSGETPEALKL